MAGLTKIADGVYLNDFGETVHMPDEVATQFGYSEQPGFSDLPPPQEGVGPVPDIAMQEVLGAVSAPPPNTQPAVQPPVQAAPQQPSSVSVEQSGTYHTLPPPPDPEAADTAAIAPHRGLQDQIVDQTFANTAYQNAGLDELAAASDETQAQKAELAQQEQYDRRYAQMQEEQRQAAEDQVYKNAQNEAAARWDSIKQVDPTRAFYDKSALGHIRDALGGLLGGLLAPNRGGKNVYLEYLNERIQRDIDAQVANIETQKTQAYRADRAVGNLREGQTMSRQDRLRAELDRRAAYDTELDALDQQFASQVYKTKIAEQKAGNMQRAMEIAHEMGREAVADDRYEFEKQEGIRRWEQQQKLDRYRASLEARRVKLSEREAEAAAANKAAEGEEVFFVPSTGEALRPDPRKKLSDAMRKEFDEKTALRYTFADKLKTYRRLEKELGGKYQGKGKDFAGWDTEDKALLRAAFADVAESKIQMVTGAAAPKEQMERIMSIIGNPEGWTTVTPLKRIDNQLRILGGEQKRAAVQLGFRGEDGKPHDWDADFAPPSDEKLGKPGVGSWTKELRDTHVTQFTGPDGLDATFNTADRAYRAMIDNPGKYNPGQVRTLTGELWRLATEVKDVDPTKARLLAEKAHTLQVAHQAASAVQPLPNRGGDEPTGGREIPQEEIDYIRRFQELGRGRK